MFKFFWKKNQSAIKNTPANDQSGFLKVAEKQLKENRTVIESLRDYDEGKKDISTTDVERRLHNVQAAS